MNFRFGVSNLSIFKIPKIYFYNELISKVVQKVLHCCIEEINFNFLNFCNCHCYFPNTSSRLFNSQGIHPLILKTCEKFLTALQPPTASTHKFLNLVKIFRSLWINCSVCHSMSIMGWLLIEVAPYRVRGRNPLTQERFLIRFQKKW